MQSSVQRLRPVVAVVRSQAQNGGVKVVTPDELERRSICTGTGLATPLQHICAGTRLACNATAA
jgi:hypothetical protein